MATHLCTAKITSISWINYEYVTTVISAVMFFTFVMKIPPDQSHCTRCHMVNVHWFWLNKYLKLATVQNFHWPVTMNRLNHGTNDQSSSQTPCKLVIAGFVPYLTLPQEWLIPWLSWLKLLCSITNCSVFGSPSVCLPVRKTSAHTL